MRAAEHYLKLREAWPWIRDGEVMTVPLEEVARALDCTRQNARLVLKELQSIGWVRWTAGRGRGHVSSLTFWQTSERVLLDLALSAVERGQVAEALERMGRLGPLRQGEVLGKLMERIGFQEEVTDSASSRDVLRTFLYGGYPCLDPVQVYYAKELNTITQVFDTLIRRDADGRVRPHLVHGWEVDAAGLVWKLYLRKGVKFHHGREMTAEDVAFTLRRLQGDSSLYRELFAGIAEVRVPKRTMVEVRLREPDALFLEMLATAPASVVPLEADTTMRAHFLELPVGTGPFRVCRNEAQLFELEAHDAYFQGRPFLDRVETWIVSPQQVRSLDWSEMGFNLYGLPDAPEVADWQEQHLEKAMVQYLAFQIDEASPMQDVDLRRALCLVLEGEELVAEVGGARSVASYGLWRSREGDSPWKGPREAPQAGDQVVASRLQQARCLLEQSTYQGEPLRLLTFLREENQQDARWIQARCKQIGVPLELEFVGGREFLQEGRWKGAHLVLKADMVDEHREFGFYRALQGQRSVIARQPWMDAALAQARRECDPLTRERILCHLDQRLQEQACLHVLYQERYRATYPPHVQGITATGLGMIDNRHVWWKDPIDKKN